jgi:WD40 repeat protein
LDGKPITARPVGWGERALKWAKRRPAIASLAAVVVLVTLVGFGATFSQYLDALEKTQIANNASRLKGIALEEKDVALAEKALAERDAIAKKETAEIRLAENELDYGLQSCRVDHNPAKGLLWMARALESSPESAHSIKQLIRRNISAWRQETFKLIGVIGGSRCPAFSPDGKLILAGNSTSGAQLFDVATQTPVGPSLVHESPVTCLGFSPDGKTLLTGSSDRTARLWNAKTGATIGLRMPHSGIVTHVAFSPNGKTVASATENTVHLWDARTGSPIGQPISHNGFITSIEFWPDSSAILTCAESSGSPSLQLWSVTSQKPVPTLLHPHTRYLTFLCFSRDVFCLSRIWKNAPFGLA